jgi:hypothetical protein
MTRFPKISAFMACPNGAQNWISMRLPQRAAVAAETVN